MGSRAGLASVDRSPVFRSDLAKTTWTAASGRLVRTSNENVAIIGVAVNGVSVDGVRGAICIPVARRRRIELMQMVVLEEIPMSCASRAVGHI